MSTIGSVGSYVNSQASSMAGAQRSHRPDPGKMAEALFSQLDTKGQGYIEKSDLQTAFEQSATASSTSSVSVDQVFSQLDGDGDGKVTQDEMSSSLSKLAAELDSQFDRMRMSGGMPGMGGAGGMPPPPPPPPGDDRGFTQDELSSQLDRIGSSDSQRSALISKIVGNFKTADADSDGKVSVKEAMAYDQATSGNSSASTASATSTNATDATNSTSNDLAIMKRIMDLMQTYRSGTADADTTNSLLSTLSVSA